jgi:hypothetical protein
MVPGSTGTTSTTALGRKSVIAPRGYNLTISGLAWVPGSTSVWAVGEADKNNPKDTGPVTEAVVARYGR